jgi:hypothetical protein
VVPLLIGVSRVEAAGTWLAADVLLPIALGVAGAILLARREAVVPEPMVPLRLFANPTFRICSSVGFLTSALMMTMTILVALDYQLAGGLSANAAGTRLLPLTAGTVLGSFIAGQIVTRTGRYRIFPIAGAIAMSAMCLAIALIGLGHTLVFDLAATGLLGLSFGFQLSPVMVALQNALDRRDTGIGMSGMIFFRLMGGAFGVALLSSILVAAFNSGAVAVPGHEVLGDNPGLALFHLEQHGELAAALRRDLADVIAGGFRVVFLVAAVIAACAALGACFIRETTLRSAVPERQPAE